ncbi:hypothetical protein GTP56_25855 [Duganella sp. FT134W]|uniref:Uncharacterized protein n=1 Tax=Duganella margarita TaxID=2692170 RepID=A0A7X4H582_9BURK|nr:hypothetical protein [Duganella margarita]MYM75597.1 hypothetical protein [Duganella margarita]
MQFIDRAMCPLKEAATRIGVPVNLLLKDAIEGRLSVYVKVPEGLRVLCVHSSHLRSSKGISFEDLSEPPFWAKGIQYLALDRQNLRGLCNVGIDRTSQFTAGISFNRDGSPIHFSAASDTRLPDFFSLGQVYIPLSLRSYVLYPIEVVLPRRGLLPSPWRGDVTLDDAYISRVDILERLGAREHEISSRLMSFEGEYISPKLDSFRKFFLEKLGEKLIKETGGLTAKRFTIELKDQFGSDFSRAGAAILVNSMEAVYGKNKSSRIEDIQILIFFECAKHFWGDGDRRPSVNDIVSWLKSKSVSIGDSYLATCAAMLRPPNLSKLRRPPSL